MMPYRALSLVLLFMAQLLVIASSMKAPPRKVTKEEQIEKELESLRGTWVLVTALRNGGETYPQSFIDTFWIEIDGNNLTMYMGKKVVRSTITIDPFQNPKQFDMLLTENKVNSPGIYNL